MAPTGARKRIIASPDDPARQCVRTGDILSTDVDTQERTIRLKLWRLAGAPGGAGGAIMSVWSVQYDHVPVFQEENIPRLLENIHDWERALKAHRQKPNDGTRKEEVLKYGRWVLQKLGSWQRAVARLEMAPNVVAKRRAFGLPDERHQAALLKDAQAYRWAVIEGREIKELAEALLAESGSDTDDGPAVELDKLEPSARSTNQGRASRIRKPRLELPPVQRKGAGRSCGRAQSAPRSRARPHPRVHGRGIAR